MTADWVVGVLRGDEPGALSHHDKGSPKAKEHRFNVDATPR
jgi:hypothetical protein